MKLGWGVLGHVGSSIQEQRPRAEYPGGWPKAVLKGRGMQRFVSWLLTVLNIFPTVLRDISERGRDLEQILSQYITFVKPAFEEFCLPVSKGSDTHASLPKMPHTVHSSSDRNILCPRAQVSLPHLAPSLQALAKMGVPVLAQAG